MAKPRSRSDFRWYWVAIAVALGAVVLLGATNRSLVSVLRDREETHLAKATTEASRKEEVKHSRRSAFVLLATGVLLVLMATLIVPVVVTLVPGMRIEDQDRFTQFLIGAGAVLIGISISAFQSAKP